MAGPLTPGRSRRLLAALAVCGALACAGCGGPPAAGHDASTADSKCGLQAAALLTPRVMPGFVQLMRFNRAQLPGSHGVPGHPPWDVTQYVCGEEEGFVSDVIMYGRYRAQDDAFARSLGYTVGKFPLVPYQGPAVAQLPHYIFEAYEEVYQFRSPTAAARWLSSVRRSPLAPHDLSGLPLPPGFIARIEVMGRDNGNDEHTFGASGQHGNDVIFVSFRGGRELCWTDVKTLWSRAYAHISAHLA